MQVRGSPQISGIKPITERLGRDPADSGRPPMGSSFFNMILSDMILFPFLSGSKPLPVAERQRQNH
jgi:hypothetical protein